MVLRYFHVYEYEVYTVLVLLVYLFATCVPEVSVPGSLLYHVPVSVCVDDVELFDVDGNVPYFGAIQRA